MQRTALLSPLLFAVGFGVLTLAVVGGQQPARQTAALFTSASALDSGPEDQRTNQCPDTATRILRRSKAANPVCIFR